MAKITGEISSGGQNDNEHSKQNATETNLKKKERGDNSQQPVSVMLKQCLLVGCCFLMLMIVLGFMAGLGVLFVEIIDTFQSTRAMGSLIQSVCMGIVFGTGAVASHVITRVGAGRVCVVGGVMSACGLVGSYFAPSLPVLIVTVGVITGFGLCTLSMVPLLIAGEVFDKRRSLALTIISIGPGVGGLVFPILNSFLVEQFGWRGAFLILAGITLQATPMGMIITVTRRDIITFKEREKGVVKRKRNANVDNPLVSDSNLNNTQRVDTVNISKQSKTGFVNEAFKAAMSNEHDMSHYDEPTSTGHKMAQNSIVSEKNLVCAKVDVEGADESTQMKGEVPETSAESSGQTVLLVDGRVEYKDDVRGFDNKQICRSMEMPVSTNQEKGSDCISINESLEQNATAKTCQGDSHIHDIKQSSLRIKLARFVSSLHLEMFKDMSFITLAVNVVLITAMFPSINFFLVDMAISKGFDAKTGSFLLSLVGFCNLAGRFLYLFLRPLFKVSQIMIFATLGMMISLCVLILAWANTYELLLLAVVCYGLPFGCVSVSYPSLMFEIAGAERYASAVGYSETLSGVGALVAGPIAGSLKDLTDSYNSVVYGATAAGCVCSLLFYAVLIRRHCKESISPEPEMVSTHI